MLTSWGILSQHPIEVVVTEACEVSLARAATKASSNQWIALTKGRRVLRVHLSPVRATAVLEHDSFDVSEIRRGVAPPVAVHRDVPVAR